MCLSSINVCEVQENGAEDPVQQVESGFGERVREARLRRKWTQRQLADNLQLDASAISRLEQGVRAVRLGEAALIARALESELGSLVFGNDVDPAAQLQSMTETADRRIDETRGAAIEMANIFLQMVQLLEDHPGFFGTVEMDDDGPIVPVALKAVLAGGLQRINNRYAVSQSRQRIVVEDGQLAAQIMALIHAAVQDIVSTVPLPPPTPSTLGRGLASLMPPGYRGDTDAQKTDEGDDDEPET